MDLHRELPAGRWSAASGDSLSGRTDIGPIANRRQFEVVFKLVAEAVADGAKGLCGGGPLQIPGFEDGLFYAPTVLADVPLTSRIRHENIFLAGTLLFSA